MFNYFLLIASERRYFKERCRLIFAGSSDKIYEISIRRKLQKIVFRISGRHYLRIALFLASDESTYCTGGIYMLDGGWTA